MTRRINTGVPGLDQLIGGGLFEKSATLVAGAPGTGKTTLGLQFIVGGIKEGQPGIMVTFEEFPEIYFRDALKFGWDLKKYQEENLLKIIFTSPTVFKSELERDMGYIDRIISQTGARRILIDPINLYEHYFEDESTRYIFNSLVNALKRNNLTSFLTVELIDLFGELSTIGENLPFIVDNIIVLKYLEIDSSVQKAILILKTRGTEHVTDIRHFEINEKGIEIADRFKDREGLLSGRSYRIPSEAFMEAFRKKKK